MSTDSPTAERSRRWKVLNGPLALLIFGFIFTTVLGSTLTYFLNSWARDQEIRLADQLKNSAIEQENRLTLFARQQEIRLRDRLQRSAREQEIRFERLHEERAAAIGSLHDKLLDVETDLYNLLYNWRPIGILPPQVKPEDVIVAVRNFRKEAEKSKVYFDAELCSVLDSVCRTLESTLKSMEQAMMRAGYPFEKGEGDLWKGTAPEFREKAWEGVHIKTSEVRKQLRSKFRKLLSAP